MTPTQEDLPLDPYSVRMRRVVSWWERAEVERKAGDLDMAFILYWIAFDAASAKDVSELSTPTGKAKSASSLKYEYFAQLLSLDRDNSIHEAIWERFSGPVRILLDNKYLFERYWDHANGKPGSANWEARFERERRRVLSALGKRRTGTILNILFQRLNTLRNQLVHGGARWRSSYNRDSVRDGARIMEFLVPVFIEIMRGHPDEDWGQPHYRPGLQEGAGAG